MDVNEIRNRLSERGLRITPQRVSVMEAIFRLGDHPSAERIINCIKMNHPNISTATVYKILDTFTERGLIRKVKTDSDVMRYDAITDPHHHLYCSASERIEDYVDQELNLLLDDYFRKRQIPGFQVEDIRLQIIGKFSKNRS